MIQYSSYNTHHVLYNSWTLMIYPYGTKLFVHNTTHIVWYSQLCMRLFGIGLGRVMYLCPFRFSLGTHSILRGKSILYQPQVHSNHIGISLPLSRVLVEWLLCTLVSHLMNFNTVAVVLFDTKYLLVHKVGILWEHHCIWI